MYFIFKSATNGDFSQVKATSEMGYSPTLHQSDEYSPKLNPANELNAVDTNLHLTNINQSQVPSS